MAYHLFTAIHLFLNELTGEKSVLHFLHTADSNHLTKHQVITMQRFRCHRLTAGTAANQNETAKRKRK